MNRAYWLWIGSMVVIAAAGSWLVRSLAFAMLAEATASPERYAGFLVGLSLPIPVVQVAPHWYAIFALWLVFCVLGFCGWRAVKVLGGYGQNVGLIYAGYAVVGTMLSFFAVTQSIDGYFYTTFERLFGVYGIDPYVLISPIRVNDPVLKQDFSLLHNPPFPDPYGPGFTLLAGLVGRLESNATLWTQLWTWRIVAVGACVLIAAALARMLRHVAPSERARRVGIFAFHPLTLYESGVGGHNDFLMIAAAIWSYAIVDDLPLIAGLLIGVAISIKYFAAVLVPFLVLRAARKKLGAAIIIVVLAALVPGLCFHPFAFDVMGKTTLVRVASSLSMSPNWLLALPLFAVKASDTAVRLVQFAIAVTFGAILLAAIVRYARTPRNSEVYRTVTSLLWSLPAMHPWYAMWLVPASAASGRWAVYAWWFGTFSLLVYAHEAVLPTPLNHAIFVILTLVLFVAPATIARSVPALAGPAVGQVAPARE